MLTMFMTASAIRALTATEFGRFSLIVAASLFFQGIFRSTSSEVIRISRDYRIDRHGGSRSGQEWPGPKHLVVLAALPVGGGLIAVAVRDLLPFVCAAFSAAQALRYDLRIRAWAIQSYFPHASSTAAALIVGVIFLRLAPPLDLEGVLLLWLALEVIALVLSTIAFRYTILAEPKHAETLQHPARLRFILSVDFVTQFAFAHFWVFLFSLESLEAAGARQTAVFIWSPFAFLLGASHQPVNRLLKRTQNHQIRKQIARLTVVHVVVAGAYGLTIWAVLPAIDQAIFQGKIGSAEGFIAPQIFAGMFQAFGATAVIFFFTPDRQMYLTTARTLIAVLTCGVGLLWAVFLGPASPLIVVAPYVLLSVVSLSSLSRVARF